MTNANEQMPITVTVRTRLEKFDGDAVPGQRPVEVIETEETVPLAAFLSRIGGTSHDDHSA